MRKSLAVRNAQLDALEATIGTSAILRLRSGAQPAASGNEIGASSGTVIATMQLPSDWMGNAAAGLKQKLGTWSDTAADAANAGGAMHWEIVASNGTTKHLDGTVTVTGGGGEVQLQNLNIAVGQPVEITAFDLSSAV